MKVYGFDSTDVIRGELQAAAVDKSDFDYGNSHLVSALGWEYVSSSFASAKGRLQVEMRKEQVDPVLISTVDSFKARDIPVNQDLT